MVLRLKSLLLACLLLTPLAPAWAVSDLHDYSTTAGTNTDIGGINVAENAPFANMNNALRELMAELKRGVAGKGSDIASAGTTAICGASTSIYAQVTGTTTITSLGTAASGCWRIVTFTGALTLTHNATSLILPSAANITTTAGAVAGFVSEGSGNWRMIFYSAVPYLSAANTFTAAQSITGTAAGALLTITTTDAGAAAGPTILSDRNSASPANNDSLGAMLFRGRDSGGTATDYTYFLGVILDTTDTSEDGALQVRSTVAGSDVAVAQFSNGIIVGSPTGSYKGAGTVNAAAGLYVNGHGTVAQAPACDTDLTYTTLGTILPVDNSIPQNTEGDEVLTVTITPTNASSLIRIRATLNVGGNTGADIAMALFVDSTAAALDAASTFIQNTSSMTTMHLDHEVSAGSTSARTYKIRAGAAAATDAFMNGNNTTRLFGGVGGSELCVEEVLPQ